MQLNLKPQTEGGNHREQCKRDEKRDYDTGKHKEK